MARGMSARMVRGPTGLRGVGGGSGSRLDLFSGGTFTRSTEGSYLTAAPTDGSTAFLAWAAVNERRIEDRGDGNGQMLLMEGSRTNLLSFSRDMSDATWSAGHAGTVYVGNAGAGPDTAVLADRTTTDASEYGKYRTATSWGAYAAGTRYAASVYARRLGGDTSYHYAIQDGAAGTGTYKETAIGSAWARYEIVHLGVNAAANVHWVPVESRTGGGLTGNAQDVLLDLHQIEAGAFPSSAIRTAGLTVTRGADRLTFTTSEYPAALLTRGFAIEFAPDFLPSEMHLNGAGFMLLGIAGNASSLQGAFLSYNVIGDPARIFVNNTASFSAPFSWSARRQRMRVEMRPSAGTITISGATSGNGTTTVAPWVITPGTIDVGQRATGSASNVWFGGLGRYIEVL